MDADEILDLYVTNRDDQVFAIHGLPGVIGAVMARYSRADCGLRETLLHEFIKEDKVNLKKAANLIERVLIAYGDDSVGELEGAHLSFEGISMLATKIIEHRRIGGSPIEQSTRYVRYDFRDPQTGFHYFVPRSIAGSAAEPGYRSCMDRIFSNYGTLYSQLNTKLEELKPISDAVYDLGEMGERLGEMKNPKHRAAFERTYRNDIKTKTCDILRAFLPLATKTNVGLFGNGRFFQHLISKMLTHSLDESRDLGAKAFTELHKVIPHYVKRAQRLGYLERNEAAMAQLAGRYFRDMVPGDCRTRMVEPDHEFLAERLQGPSPSPAAIRLAMIEEEDLTLATGLIYAFVNAPFDAIRARLRQLPQSVQSDIVDGYYGERETRRDRPERAIELGYPYTFDLVTEWAVYKDLMRHRMGTILVQPMSPRLGFEMPAEIEADPQLLAVARDTLSQAEDLFAFLDRQHPGEREYALLQGHKIRWLLGMNDRALMHMLELRTAPQGHANYRATCQELHRLAQQRFPSRAARMNFVNHDTVFWSRGDAEARQRVKEDKLGAIDLQTP